MAVGELADQRVVLTWEWIRSVQFWRINRWWNNEGAPVGAMSTGNGKKQ